MTFHLRGAAWNDMTPPMAGELRNERLELFLSQAKIILGE